MRSAWIGFCLGLLLTASAWSATSANRAPYIFSIDNGVNKEQGLLWLRLQFTDLDGDPLFFKQADYRFTGTGGSVTDSGNVSLLDQLEGIVLTTSPVLVSWIIPPTLLDLNMADLTLRFQLSDNVEVSNISELIIDNLNVRAIRERGWYRNKESGFSEVIFTNTPGNYAELRYLGAGLIHRFGVDVNMGMVELTMDGNVLPNSPMDNYPKDLPPGVIPDAAHEARYRKGELYASPVSENQQHTLRMTLSEQVHANAIGQVFAMTYFTHEEIQPVRFEDEREVEVGANGEIIDDTTTNVGNRDAFVYRDITTDDDRLKLFTLPPLLGESALAEQLAREDFFGRVVPIIQVGTATEVLVGKTSFATLKQKSAMLAQASPGVNGWKLVVRGPGETEKILVQQNLSLNTTSWKKDCAYSVRINALGPLGMASAETIHALLISPEGADRITLNGQQAVLSVQGGAVGLSGTHRSGGQAALVYYENAKPVVAAAEEDESLVYVQALSSMRGPDLELSNTSPRKMELRTWSTRLGQWQEVELEAGQRARFKATSVILLKGSGVGAESGSGGSGGCFFR